MVQDSRSIAPGVEFRISQVSAVINLKLEICGFDGAKFYIQGSGLKVTKCEGYCLHGPTSAVVVVVDVVVGAPITAMF